MIYKRLRIAVDDCGLNQKEFALRIGKSPNGFNAIVRGHKQINKTLALAVQVLTSYSADWIMTGEGPRKIDPLEGLDHWSRLVLELSNNSDRKIAELVFFWLDSRAAARKFSFDKDQSWNKKTLSRYEELIQEAKGFLFDILNNSEGGEEQVLLRGMLLILYNGLEGLDLESDEMKFLLNFEDFRLERVKEIRSELENLIGDGLKKENRTSNVITDW